MNSWAWKTLDLDEIAVSQEAVEGDFPAQG